ncbi:thaumatin family protein [Streptomyces sp. Ag109_O5-1]|uniref:thaumatin family protein n=1 Tax=Streptomyces sp. Ag109_O5-1 TaxID=1938851 RepID=UPI000F5151B7|nr:thaumatin family protein [Streptomyces sp. Ag109_O5-1]RPE41765.1 thaumatin family protein [Streptomyces sp. Ag109_O5-1]
MHHRRNRRRSGLAATAAVLLTCLALVTGVVLARMQSGPAPKQHTVAAVPAATPDTTATTAMPLAGASPKRSPSPSASPRVTKSAPAKTSATSTTKQPAAATGPVGKRTITLVNRLHETIWPAIAADPKHPVAATGWVLRPGQSLSFAIPDHWDVRLWARTGCSFDAAGNGTCLSGGCGKFQCGSTWGEFPSTLAEFNLNAWNGMDFYDASQVEGYNLPMWVNSYGGTSKDKIDANGCTAAGCVKDTIATCPKKLQRTRDGRVVACLSACLVFNTDQTCCTGAYAARPQCVPSSWPIDSATVFKAADPNAYSYVNDDATSVFTCSGECGYRVTWGVSP